MEAIALPEPLRQFKGRITDVDAHEQIPVQLWVETFGPEVQELADAWIAGSVPDTVAVNSSNVPGYPGDVAEVTADVTSVKGSRAPGAVDVNRRLEVMDAMGVDRQLMFPTSVGMWAVMLHTQARYDPQMLSRIKDDREGKSKLWLDCYNKWMVKQVKASAGRVRPVTPVLGDTVEELINNTRPLLEAGIRAIWLASGTLPGGKSPAHADLDPFWALLVEHRCVVTLHIGAEGHFLEHLKEWKNAAPFEGYRTGAEFSLDPWFSTISYVPTQNFIQTMVLGGVFVRHPELRVGVVEVQAHWVGPMMRVMDDWYKMSSGSATKDRGISAKHPHALPKTPSEYVKSNIRVSPFSFEDVASYIERDPALEDVLCFSSDYPHVEGGKDMMNVLYKQLERFGPKVIEKFFVTNGQLLLPD
jgi:predicted TIM-barrel fold metal-dependent hydrolase